MSTPITEVHRKFAQFIADSEARAVAEVVNALTCTHHNDKQRAECPVCLVATLTAERDSLRTQVEQKRHLLVIALRSAGDQETRASRAETELATERARLDWLEGNAGDIPKYNSRSFIWFANQNIRAAIDAAMKEGA